MSKLKCIVCGGQIEIQEDMHGLCLNCGTSYSLASMKKMISGAHVSANASGADIEKWRQLADRYYASGDFLEAERFVKKILEEIPEDENAFKLYEELQVLKNMDIIDGVLRKYTGNAKVLVIPDIVIRIEPKVFQDNRDIEEVVLPNELTEIPYALFDGCWNLIKVRIPDTVTIINPSGFSRCGFQSIELPRGLKILAKNSFWGCGKLGSIHLPGGLESIGDGAFHGCPFEEIEIPASVKSLGSTFTNKEPTSTPIEGVFDRCYKLRSVHLHEGLEGIGARAFCGTSIEEMVLPVGLKRIGYEAFMNCSYLKRLVIPDSVVTTYAEKLHLDGYLKNYPWSKCPQLEVIEYPQHFDPEVFEDTPYYKKNFKPKIPYNPSEIAFQQMRWRSDGVCQHCGGKFGYFTGKCVVCGRKKDY